MFVGVYSVLLFREGPFLCFLNCTRALLVNPVQLLFPFHPSVWEAHWKHGKLFILSASFIGVIHVISCFLLPLLSIVAQTLTTEHRSISGHGQTLKSQHLSPAIHLFFFFSSCPLVRSAYKVKIQSNLRVAIQSGNPLACDDPLSCHLSDVQLFVLIHFITV